MNPNEVHITFGIPIKTPTVRPRDGERFGLVGLDDIDQTNFLLVYKHWPLPRHQVDQCWCAALCSRRRIRDLKNRNGAARVVQLSEGRLYGDALYRSAIDTPKRMRLVIKGI